MKSLKQYITESKNSKVVELAVLKKDKAQTMSVLNSKMLVEDIGPKDSSQLNYFLVTFDNKRNDLLQTSEIYELLESAKIKIQSLGKVGYVNESIRDTADPTDKTAYIEAGMLEIIEMFGGIFGNKAGKVASKYAPQLAKILSDNDYQMVLKTKQGHQAFHNEIAAFLADVQEIAEGVPGGPPDDRDKYLREFNSVWDVVKKKTPKYYALLTNDKISDLVYDKFGEAIQ